MAGSSSADAIMGGAPELNTGGTPQHFKLSPRSEDVGGDQNAGRRTLRAARSDPEVPRQRQAVQPGETQMLWIQGSPRSVSPRTVEYGRAPKSPRTPIRTSPTGVAQGMLSPPVLRDLSDDAAAVMSGSRGSGHNLNELGEPVSGGGTGFANQSTPEVPLSDGGRDADGEAQGGGRSGATRRSGVYEKFEQSGKKCFCRNLQGEHCREGGTEIGSFEGPLPFMGVVFTGEGFYCFAACVYGLSSAEARPHSR